MRASFFCGSGHQFLMAEGLSIPQAPVVPRLTVSRNLRIGIYVGLCVFVASVVGAVFLRKGFALTAFGDSFQVLLVAAGCAVAFANFLRSHSRTRIFWFLIFAGSFQWALSNAIWAFYEVLLAKPVPDLPFIDILLFLKAVPFTAAIAIAPDREHNAQYRVFGLIDVFVLMVYALYLFVFGVFAYRLLPGAQANYNFYFNLADAIGNQTLIVATGIAALWAQGSWRTLYRLYFFAAACYGLASDLSNVAIDMGRYYTGSLYDVPLIASMAAFLCFTLMGRQTGQETTASSTASSSEGVSARATFFSEHLAMLVALSTPFIGMWSLFSDSAPSELRVFRLSMTLLCILVLTLLISVKQDILATGLFQSLQRLSETYRNIDRLKNHLIQSEKLTSLGELVADAANQIHECMASILTATSRITGRPGADFGVQNMAGKIGQYAQRTNALVDNMLHFAQETPMRLESLDVKPLLESAFHLSRAAKTPNVRFEFSQEGEFFPVRADSSQLLHVFLQLISNAIDALEEVGGGSFRVNLKAAGAQIYVEFADSGSGLKEPQRVFEPFYTTKPVGKGTGLGLSTCYGIIQQHDGEISCRNQPEGGAVFTVRIPFATERPAGVQTSAELVAGEAR
jgi:signal transduction histidine kinase